MWFMVLTWCFAVASNAVALDVLLSDQRARDYQNVHFSPDGRFVVASCLVPRREGRAIAIWEVASGDLLQWIGNTTKEIPGGVADWDFCPPNHLVAVSPDSSTIFLIQHGFVDRKDAWKLVARLRRRIDPRNRLVGMDAVACSADGKQIACTSASTYRPGFTAKAGAIEIWDVAQQRIAAMIQSPDQYPDDFNFIGEEFVFRCSSGIVRASMESDVLAARKDESFGTSTPGFSTLAVSPSQRQIVVGGKGFIAILDAQNLDTLKKIALPAGEVPEVIRYTPDGKWLVEGEATQFVRVRNAVTGEIVGQRELSRIASLDVSPDGETIAVTEWSMMKGVQLWKLKDLIDEAE